MREDLEQNQKDRTQRRESNEGALKKFREEITELKRKEEIKESPTAHFLYGAGFNVNDLTEDDMAIWEKTKNGTVEEEDWNNYQKNLIDPVTGFSRKDILYSRHVFMAFIANMVNPIFGRKQIEKMKKEKNEKLNQ